MCQCLFQTLLPSHSSHTASHSHTGVHRHQLTFITLFSSSFHIQSHHIFHHTFHTHRFLFIWHIHPILSLSHIPSQFPTSQFFTTFIFCGHSLHSFHILHHTHSTHTHRHSGFTTFNPIGHTHSLVIIHPPNNNSQSPRFLLATQAMPANGATIFWGPHQGFLGPRGAGFFGFPPKAKTDLSSKLAPQNSFPSQGANFPGHCQGPIPNQGSSPRFQPILAISQAKPFVGGQGLPRGLANFHPTFNFTKRHIPLGSRGQRANPIPKAFLSIHFFGGLFLFTIFNSFPPQIGHTFVHTRFGAKHTRFLSIVVHTQGQAQGPFFPAAATHQGADPPYFKANFQENPATHPEIPDFSQEAPYFFRDPPQKAQYGGAQQAPSPQRVSFGAAQPIGLALGFPPTPGGEFQIPWGSPMVEVFPPYDEGGALARLWCRPSFPLGGVPHKGGCFHKRARAAISQWFFPR